MIPLFKPFLAPEALAAVGRTFDSGTIAEGPRVKEFERQLEALLCFPVVAVNSCTSALWLAYDLAGIQPGDYVVSTPITCLATNIPLLHFGAKILWADVDPRNGLIDPASVARLCKNYPVKAVVGVDYGGIPCDVKALLELCPIVIEDAAQALLAERGGKMVGEEASFTAYSFQAIKHLTTGDGGALAVPSEAGEALDAGPLEMARLKRWFGLDRNKGGFRCEQLVEQRGYKFQMNDIAASIGLANLPHLIDVVAQTRNHATAYQQAFEDASVSLPCAPSGTVPSWWSYVLRVEERERFIAAMAERGVQTARIHSRNDFHPVFTGCRRDGLLPGVAEFDRDQVSLPTGWWLSEDDVALAIKAVRESVA